MCVKCKEEKYSLEEIPRVRRGEEGQFCEWFDEEEAEEEAEEEEDAEIMFCGEPAVAVVHEEIAEDHLCLAHVQAEKAERSAGLEEFIRSTGLEEACEFLPIDPGETCDECPSPATHVKVATVPTALCREHAEPYRKGSG